MPEAKHFYEFGPFRLDPAERSLLCDNEAIPLTPKAFETLLLLVEYSGHLLTKDELMKRLWPDTFVEEVNLAQNISAIRRALDDKNGGVHYIETVHRWPVTRLAVIASATILVIAIALLFIPRIVNFRAKGTSAASAATAIRSIAVLPLVNLSSDSEQEYFSDGMTDELITELAKVGRLRVISHTSVQRYKETKRPLPEIARELSVDAVVEGTVMRSGDRVRITAQLIDARSDRHLWAESYERDLREVLTLQDEVAQRIATQVGINLTAGDQTRMVSTRVVDSGAHEAYLKGNFYWNRSNCEGSKRALEYFQQAVDKDPNFAPAYLGLAETYFTLGDWGCWPQHEAFAKARPAALRAIELDHNLGAAHAWLGMLAFSYEWEWQNAENEFKQAIELDPNYSFAHLAYAVFLVTVRKPEQGFAEMRRAHELDPTSELTNMVSVHVFYLARQYDPAIEQAKIAIELNPGSWGAYYWLGASYERKGMYEQASAAYLKSKALDGLGPEELDAFRSAYRKSGIRGYWQQELATVKPNRSECWMAVIYAHMGDKDRTLEYLNRGFQHHCTDLRMLNADAIYDSLREDPRFQYVLHRMKFPGLCRRSSSHRIRNCGPDEDEEAFSIFEIRHEID